MLRIVCVAYSVFLKSLEAETPKNTTPIRGRKDSVRDCLIICQIFLLGVSANAVLQSSGMLWHPVSPCAVQE